MDHCPNDLDIKLFAVALAGLDQPPAPWLTVLEAAEHSKAARFKNAQDRTSYVAAHALTRWALAAELSGQAAADLRFRENEYGKPGLIGHDLHFNLSHTHDMAVVALCRSGPVGVDVEQINPTHAHPGLAQDIFTPEEFQTLQNQPGFAAAFTALWTAKEAIIKAEGQGLALNLAAIRITPTQGWGPSGPWVLWRDAPTDDHMITLAFRGRTVQRRLMSVDDLTVFGTSAQN